MKQILLLSGSSYQDTGYLRHCKNWIKDFLGEDYKNEILFIPYASVRKSYDEFEQKAIDRLKTKSIKSIHHFQNQKEAIKNARSIAVGGGNTFALLAKLYELDLIEILREKIESGTKYFGWSAGANIAGKSICTTNDMPIIMPKSFEALNVFPHQINPHFISGKIAGHNGESREERFEEFLIAHKDTSIFALPEGTAIKISGENAEVMGYADILKFSFGRETEILKVGQNFKI